MSADRQRLVSAIRKIAITDPEIRSLLDDAQSRGSQPPSTGVGASDAESDRQCCDGSVGSSTNPGVNQRDPDAEGAGQTGGLDSDDPARLTMGEGSLTGVTDCATGDPVCFDGDDWLPPDGWESPTDPPVSDFYEDGFYWANPSATVVDVYYGVLPEDVFDQLPNSITVDGADYTKDRLACGSTSNCDAVYDKDVGTGAYLISIEKINCPSSFSNDDIEDACNPSPDETTLDAWPEDGCINLAIKRGTLVGSKFDPENDGSYSDPKSEIQLCDGAGNQIKLSPSADGGWKTIDAINPGDGYLYDSQGNQIARISDDEYSDPKV